jgi:hypothetical protein
LIAGKSSVHFDKDSYIPILVVHMLFAWCRQIHT